MDFTREPIIQTIITPKEGHKLVIRSSTCAGQEEYFVDAVEIVSFGNSQFFRSLERPKAFLVPVSDYEVLEVREARMVLKNAGLDRSIKIGGGRDGTFKPSREAEKEIAVETENENESQSALQEIEAGAEVCSDVKIDKKRDRRRHYRKRRGREDKEETAKGENGEPSIPPLEDERINIAPPVANQEEEQEGIAPLTSTLLSSLLQPPPTLISETINRYRQNDLFKAAFYLTEEEQYKPHDKVQDLLNEEDEEENPPSLQEPSFAPLVENSQSEQENVFVAQNDVISEQSEIQTAAFNFESEEENILRSRLPFCSENNDIDLQTESPYEPVEEPETENEPHPLNEK